MNTANQPRLQAGGTLNPRRHIYIRRPHDDRLLGLLLEGQYVNVLTSRQMGKSSLVMRTALELRERGVRFVIIDLASALGGRQDAESYYLGLIGQIGRSLDLPLDVGAWWRERPDETFNQRLLRFFREPVAEGVDGPVVIFLDEIDSTLSLDFTDDLFTAMRGMYNERTLVPAYERISFSLLGVATPNELVKDRRTTAYNVGHTLELDDFDRSLEDLTPIARALSDDSELGDRLLDRVLYWTGGHPYLTVKMCVDLKDTGASSEADVDRHVDETYGRLERVAADVHFQQILRFVANRLSDSLASLDLYARILKGERERDQTTLTHAELKLSGLVKRDAEGLLVVRNRIYGRLFDRRWVASSKPRRELARYRQWALAASFLLLMVIGGMSAFFWWASVKEYPPAIAARGLLTRAGLWPAVEPEMVKLPGGPFQMGCVSSLACGDDEKPVHSVTIKPFAIGQYEVTFAEYDQFAAATGRPLPGDQGWGRGSRPVINVSWRDTVAFAQWLSKRTGKRYHLPTEAEWEYAARAGTETKYWWGDDLQQGSTVWANCDGCGSTWDNKQTAPVGSFAANEFGLYDTAGNVWEWTSSRYKDYPYRDDDGREDPESGGRCVIRGGSWGYRPRYLRSANRDGSDTGLRNDNLGFRLAEDP